MGGHKVSLMGRREVLAVKEKLAPRPVQGASFFLECLGTLVGPCGNLLGHRLGRFGPILGLFGDIQRCSSHMFGGVQTSNVVQATCFINTAFGLTRVAQQVSRTIVESRGAFSPTWVVQDTFSTNHWPNVRMGTVSKKKSR